MRRDDGHTFEEPYDKLILSTGAAPLRPPVPGVEHPAVLPLRNIPDMDAIKARVDAGAERAVVVGGSYIGVEVAEALRERGVEVHLVEMAPQVMPPLDEEMARELAYHLEAHEVRLHLGIAAESFANVDGRVCATLADGTQVVADLVVLAAGVRPETSLAAAAGLRLAPGGALVVDPSMRTSDPDVYAVGDAVEVTDTVTGQRTVVPLAGPANRQGRVAADHLFGRPTRYTSTQGTAIVKIFEMTAGATGANERSLRAQAIPYHKVYLHPNGHASYYPGTHPLHLKVLFSPGQGTLLGAQIVGFDGVDKRLDVLAVAIRAGLTVFDLESLELAYAPPYGSAKDPVNLAGFMAANLLRGDLRLWYAEQWPACVEEGVLVDVRTPEEHAEWTIPESVNLPLDEVRVRLEALPRDRPIRLYCRSGFRSYLAYRILVQRGFADVATLAGGTMTFEAVHRTGQETGRPGHPVIPYAEDVVARARIGAG